MNVDIGIYYVWGWPWGGTGCKNILSLSKVCGGGSRGNVILVKICLPKVRQSGTIKKN